jgi:amino acid transporter
VSEFAPPEYQKLLSYVTGWLSTLSWQAGAAAGSYLSGTIIQALIIVNNPNYEPKSWQGTLLVFAMALLLFIANIWGARAMPTIQNILLIIHVFSFFAIIFVIWFLAPLNSAKIVFTQFRNDGGWPSVGVSLMTGQISAVYGLICSDATAHMAEEVKDAGRNVPNAMLWSYLLNGTLGFVLVITYLFALTDIEAAVNDPTGYPFIWVFRQAVSFPGVNVLTVLVLTLNAASMVPYNASTSRQTFAFARDQGLPKWIGTVHPTLHVPANAVALTCGITCLLSLINIGSYTAFNALVSLQICGLMFSYSISISCVLYRRICHPNLLPSARWSLGRAGVIFNILGVGYSLFVFFWCFWPQYNGFSLGGFNWSSVIFIGTCLICAVMYAIQGRHHYTGPVTRLGRDLRF